MYEDDKKKLDSIGLDENNHAIIQATQVGNLQQAISQYQYIKTVSPGHFTVTPQGELQLKGTPAIDLNGYVQTSLYQAEVGDLSQLNHRVNNNSTLVEEINSIKESIIWQGLIN